MLIFQSDASISRLVTEKQSGACIYSYYLLQGVVKHYRQRDIGMSAWSLGFTPSLFQ